MGMTLDLSFLDLKNPRMREAIKNGLKKGADGSQEYEKMRQRNEIYANQERHHDNHGAKQRIIDTMFLDAGIDVSIPDRFNSQHITEIQARGDGQAQLIKNLGAWWKKQKDTKTAGCNLLIHGTPGNGKTQAVLSMLLWLREKHYKSTAYIEGYEINNLFSRNAWEHGQVLDVLGKVEILVIDEMTSATQTSLRGFVNDKENTSEANHIRKIIFRRYKNKLPTIIITNKTPSVIKDLLDDAAYDRITGHGGMIVEVKGESLR